MLCFFCALFCILGTIPFLYPILISCAYSVFVLNLGAVCLFFFCVSYEEPTKQPASLKDVRCIRVEQLPLTPREREAEAEVEKRELGIALPF